MLYDELCIQVFLQLPLWQVLSLSESFPSIVSRLIERHFETYITQDLSLSQVGITSSSQLSSEKPILLERIYNTYCNLCRNKALTTLTTIQHIYPYFFQILYLNDTKRVKLINLDRNIIHNYFSDYIVSSTSKEITMDLDSFIPRYDFEIPFNLIRDRELLRSPIIAKLELYLSEYFSLQSTYRNSYVELARVTTCPNILMKWKIEASFMYMERFREIGIRCQMTRKECHLLQEVVPKIITTQTTLNFTFDHTSIPILDRMGRLPSDRSYKDTYYIQIS